MRVAVRGIIITGCSVHIHRSRTVLIGQIPAAVRSAHYLEPRYRFGIVFRRRIYVYPDVVDSGYKCRICRAGNGIRLSVVFDNWVSGNKIEHFVIRVIRHGKTYVVIKCFQHNIGFNRKRISFIRRHHFARYAVHYRRPALEVTIHFAFRDLHGALRTFDVRTVAYTVGRSDIAHAVRLSHGIAEHRNKTGVFGDVERVFLVYRHLLSVFKPYHELFAFRHFCLYGAYISFQIFTCAAASVYAYGIVRPRRRRLTFSRAPRKYDRARQYNNETHYYTTYLLH